MTTQTEEQRATADFKRLVRLLLVVESTWVIAVYGNGLIRQQITEQLRQELDPLPVIEISLTRANPNPLLALQHLQSEYSAPVVCFTGIDNALEQGLSGYLDLQRESLARLPHRLIFWMTNRELIVISKNAPNFYSRISGIFRFLVAPVTNLDITSRRSHSQVISGNARVGTAVSGDVHGSIFIGEKADSNIESGFYGRSIDRQIFQIQRRIEVLEEQENSNWLDIYENWHKLAELYLNLNPPAWERTADAYRKAASIAARFKRIDLQAESLLQAGNASYRSRLLENALVDYKSALDLYYQSNNNLGQANVQQALGNVYQFRDEYDSALQSYQVALNLYRQVGDRLGEARVLQAIGDVLQFRKESDAALQSYQVALNLYRQVGDRLGEARVLQAIGDVLQFRKESDAALQSYQVALNLYRQVGDRLGEARVLQAIGDVLQFRRQFEEAMEIYSSALSLAREVGDRLGQADILYNIGGIQQLREDMDAALENYSIALALYREIGTKLGEANALRSAGDIKYLQQKYDAAQQSYLSALSIYQAIGDRLGEANTLRSIGDIQGFQQKYDAAQQSYLSALSIYQAIGDRLGEANTLVALGQQILIGGEISDADTLLNQAIDIYRAIGADYSIASQIGNYGWTLLTAGQSEQARRYLLRAAELFAEMGLDDLANQHRQAAEPETASVLKEFEPFLQAVATVARGGDTQRTNIESILPKLEEKGWHLTEPIMRIWAGERDGKTITANLDKHDKPVIERVLEILSSAK